MENALTPTLEQTLAQVIQQLANFFGTTTTAITDGLPGFLTTYAWYHTFNNLWYIPVIIFCSLLLTATIWMVFGGDEDDFFKFMKIGLLVSIAISASILIKNIILCFICPEIVGGMALLEKIGYLTK